MYKIVLGMGCACHRDITTLQGAARDPELIKKLDAVAGRVLNR